MGREGTEYSPVGYNAYGRQWPCRNKCVNTKYYYPIISKQIKSLQENGRYAPMSAMCLDYYIVSKTNYNKFYLVQIYKKATGTNFQNIGVGIKFLLTQLAILKVFAFI